MFLIAPGARELARYDDADAKTKAPKATSKDNFTETFSQTEEQHEYHTKIKSGFVDLHRQMDTRDFVCTWRQALSPWQLRR